MILPLLLPTVATLGASAGGAAAGGAVAGSLAGVTASAITPAFAGLGEVAGAAAGAATAAETAGILGSLESVGGLAASVLGTGGQIVQGHKAAGIQEKAKEQQEGMEEYAGRRERIKAVREARIKRAMVEAAGANTGVSNSSGVVGGTSSISSQLASNLSYMNTQQDYANKMSGYNQDIANTRVASNLFGTVGGIGNQVFQDAGGWTTIFGGNPQKVPGMGYR